VALWGPLTGSYVITYTSMPIEAASAEQAIERDGNGGGLWRAVAVPTATDALPLDAWIDDGDDGLNVAHIVIGGMEVHCYQVTDDGSREPVRILEIDNQANAPIRVYVDDAPLLDQP